MLNEDISQIRPEDVKTESEGKGKLYAAYAKELDEHNILGKEQARKNFLTKGCIIGFILIIVSPVIMLILMFTLMPILFNKLDNDPGWEKTVTQTKNGTEITYSKIPIKGSTIGPN